MQFDKNLIEWITTFNLRNYHRSASDIFQKFSFPPLLPHKSTIDTFSTEHRCLDHKGSLRYIGFINKDFQRHGHGTEFYPHNPSKIKYEGFFKNDLPLARIDLIYNEDNKQIFSGPIIKGKPTTGIVYDPTTGLRKFAGCFNKEGLQHGDLCYIWDKDEQLLCSGKFIDGFPINDYFCIYYKSGNCFYKGVGNECYLYHDLSAKSYKSYLNTYFKYYFDGYQNKTVQGNNSKTAKLIKFVEDKEIIESIEFGDDMYYIDQPFVFELTKLKITNQMEFDLQDDFEIKGVKWNDNENCVIRNVVLNLSGIVRTTNDSYELSNIGSLCESNHKNNNAKIKIYWKGKNKGSGNSKKGSSTKIYEINQLCLDNDENESIIKTNDTKKIFDGVLVDNSMIKNGVLNYKTYQDLVEIDLSNDKDFSNEIPNLVINNKLYYGNIDNIEFSLEYQKLEYNDENYLVFQPTLKNLEGFFKIYTPQEQIYQNNDDDINSIKINTHFLDIHPDLLKYTNLEYLGFIKNNKRNGFGYHYHHKNIQIKTKWSDGLIDDYVQIKNKERLVFVGKAVKAQLPNKKNHNFPAHEILENCEGFTRTYHSNGKLKYMGYISQSKKNSNFAVDFRKQGEFVYCGGYNNGKYHGKGTEYFENGKFRIKKLGVFNNGWLHGKGYYHNAEIGVEDDLVDEIQPQGGIVFHNWINQNYFNHIDIDQIYQNQSVVNNQQVDYLAFL